MILTTFQFLLMVSIAVCYPQTPEIPGITNFSDPEDINDLAHHQETRSIESNVPPSNNLEETVKEVEAMLISNPQLPRLTRGEILDLLENITRTDQSRNQIVQKAVSTPKRDPKAIMVVLPYTAENSNDKSVEDLYTKAPITHIVHAQSFQKAEQEAATTKSKQVVNTYTLDTDEYNKPTGDKVKKFRNNYHRRPTIPSSTSIKPPIEPTSTEPPKQTYPTGNKIYSRRRRPEQQTTTSTLPPVTTRSRRPIRRRPSSTTTTEKHPNHRYPEEPNGLGVVTAPTFSPHVINEDLLMVEDQNKEVMVENDSPVSFERVTIREIDLSNGEASTALPLIKIDVPEHLKGIVADMELESAVQKQPKAPEHHQDVSAPKEEEIRNMLASLGVFPSQVSTTTTTQIPDISNVADNLSPDMRELLMSFGLISDPKNNLASASQVLDSYDPVEPDIDPQAYVGFKPLPEDDKTREDMSEFLAKFGLGRSARNKKEMKRGGDKVDEENELNLEMVPEEYQGVLEDIGLSNRNGKMIRSGSLVKTQEKQSFNPSDTQYASEEEIEKLNKLVDIVKQLESLNRTVTEDDLKNIDMENLKELVESLQVGQMGDTLIPLNEQHAPDPNEYDYGLTKNEVKRQEDKEVKTAATPTSTPSTTEEPTTPTSSPSTTEEPATPSIKDLEDSFGGNSETATETTEPETTTVRRKTGFYYLVDWNSFLDIDDQKGKRVNLRFQPTIGDPKRFYSVSVP